MLQIKKETGNTKFAIMPTLPILCFCEKPYRHKWNTNSNIRVLPPCVSISLDYLTESVVNMIGCRWWTAFCNTQIFWHLYSEKWIITLTPESKYIENDFASRCKGIIWEYFISGSKRWYPSCLLVIVGYLFPVLLSPPETRTLKCTEYGFHIKAFFWTHCLRELKLNSFYITGPKYK